MITDSVSLDIRRRFGVLFTVAALAVGAAAVHAAPATAQVPPPGNPQEAGAELPPYNCGGCSLPAPDNDWDDDGLSNSSESVHRTDPRHPDSDIDGLLDGLEVRERYEYARDGKRPRNRTRPTVWDTDRDGHSDGLEVTVTKTNPVKWDTDKDGLSDGAEGRTHRTNPHKYDTDGDCMSDGAEVRAGTDPTKRPAVRPLNCQPPKKVVTRPVIANVGKLRHTKPAA